MQTSTAVAAGISQFQPPREEHPTSTTLKVPQSIRGKEKSPLGKSPTTASRLEPVRGRAEDPESPPKPRKSGWLRLTNPAVNSRPYIGPEKILLRIDAFLGEWLSPDYYEDITPPPNSTMMVAGAKADLLRRSDYIEAAPKAPSAVGHFPGGWARSNPASSANSRQNTQDGQFPTLGSLAQALPQRERSNSHGSMLSRQRSRSQDPHAPVELTVTHKSNSHLYDAPNPSYAVSPSNPIPRGYVNHARDACLKIDFQWDSMRDPQQWGDGGEFGDEWSTMHKRFRRGLAGMMQWYREHGTKTLPPQNMFPGFTFTERTTSSLKRIVPASEPKPKADDEDEEELVLVLITHGAGCNALLGAITNQPVLMDISLASLSMAVRRDLPRVSSKSTVYARRSSIVDPGMAETYEMKIMASVDHLRPGNDPSKLAQSKSPSTVASPSIGLDYRPPRRKGTSGTSTPISRIESPSSVGSTGQAGWNGALGNMRRTSREGSFAHVPSNTPSGSTSPSVGGSGLWGGSLSSISFNETQQDGRASPGADMVEAFNSHPKPTTNMMYSQAPNMTSTPSTMSTVDGTASPKTAAVNGIEDNEKHDDVAPLFVPKKTASVMASGGGGWMAGSTTASSTGGSKGGGLWGAPKKQETTNGLWNNSSVMWGPPRLDEVYEHGRGPKRRWTFTENE